jgi:predicted DNA-binding transcriptional regulator AlpA
METLILTSKDDLRQMLREIIQEELALSYGQEKFVKVASEEVLLTRAEMAKFLRISLVTLTDWVRRGLPVHRKRKRGRVLFIKSEVLDWLQQKPDLKVRSGRTADTLAKSQLKGRND